VIADDLQESISRSTSGSSDIIKFFSQHSSHLFISIFVLLQNFHFSPMMRNVTINCDQLIFMRSPRDSRFIHYVASQAFPRNPAFLVDSYIRATEDIPYSHLHIDLSQKCPNQYRVRSNILSSTPTIYLPLDRPEQKCHVKRRRKS
jgi:hypothetical protein